MIRLSDTLVAAGRIGSSGQSLMERLKLGLSFMKTPRIESLPEFDGHRFVSFLYDHKSGLRGFIAIHRAGSLERPAFGATRCWKYRSEEEAARDSLRLSRLMSYKAALAGVPYGGAKGVIMAPAGKRDQVLKSYAERINFLGGRFITGTDAGIDDRDLRVMNTISPYLVGFRADPSKYTALGLLKAVEASLEEKFSDKNVKGRSFAIQGLGKVGTSFLKLIYPKAEIIYAADIDKERVKTVQKRFPRVRIVPPASIHKQKVDIFSPCALSHALNRETIPELDCPIVAGAANNQLESLSAGELLHKRGILYAPDYAANAGGLISVVDEYEHKKSDPARLEKQVNKIGDTLAEIFALSRKEKRPTHEIADEIAEKRFNGGR
jgi:leucine dehydrogenase